MAWPLSQDYNEALQNPSSFADPELAGGEPVANAVGLPIPRSGNFADVYEFRGAGGSRWALKCFTREVLGLRDRYREIGKHLAAARLPFTVEFHFLEQGIRIAGRWYPVLKMQWVEGLLLNEFVRGNLDKPELLEKLGHIWLRMAQRLREAGVAHADLQHGNVILVPGSRATSLAVKLIDYDGMWVPALARAPSGEIGHSAYQHPQRLQQQTYNAAVDRLPLLAIACSLRALAVGGTDLWQRYDNGDNLLFRKEDLRRPGASPLFKELWNMPDPAVHDLVGYLALGLAGPLEQTPLLSDVMMQDKPRPLSADQEEQVTTILGPGATIERAAAPVARPVVPQEHVQLPEVVLVSVNQPTATPAATWDALQEEEAPAPPAAPRPQAQARSRSRLIWVSAAALLVAVAAGFLFIGKKPATSAGKQLAGKDKQKHPKGPSKKEKEKERKLTPVVAAVPRSLAKLPGLVAYWPFEDDDFEEYVADRSGNGNHGKAQGASSTPGVRGQALALSGQDSFFDYGDGPFNFPANGGFTFACWIKTTLPSGVVLAQRNSREGGAVLDLMVADSRFRTQVRPDRSGHLVEITGRIKVADNRWHHVALTRNGDIVAIYVDGQEDGRRSRPGVQGPITTDLRAVGMERYWAMEKQQSLFGVRTCFEGAVDELFVFNQPLSEEQIALLVDAKAE